MKKRLLTGFIAILILVSLVSGVFAENLQYGSEGNQVNQAQSRLKDLGYYLGDIDSKYGYTTYLSVRAFQTKNALKVDGIIGETTNLILYGTPIKADSTVALPVTYLRITYGSAGPGVMTVQGALRDLGYYTGGVEGIFRYSTFLAVKKFQQDKGLAVDGVVGPETWALLTGGMTPPPNPPSTDPKAKLPYKYNDAGPGVLLIQQKLNVLGYTVGSLDESFDYMTYLAVRDFQKNNALAVDGIVGMNTWDKLFGPSPVPADAVPLPVDPANAFLKYGNVGPQVGLVQKKLADLGYLAENMVDNKFGLSTSLAVRAFQRNNVLKVDGIVGPETKIKLFGANPTPADAAPPANTTLRLQYGNSGTQVKQLQTMLAGLGYLEASMIDSIFDYKTYQAVRLFQRVNSLQVDGVVGQKTWDLLIGGTALPKP